MAADAAEIGRLQTETWRIAYQKVLPAQVLAGLDAEQFAAGWRSAILEPPSASHHVLLAMEGEHRVGFAAFGPDADHQPGDPDPAGTAAIGVLLVEPRWGRRGHGSRLLAAVADTATGAGLSRLVAWVAATDTASLEFYRSAGWAADGLRRELDTGAGTVAELRLHAALAD
ncbi:MAG: GNAT family N-acetyltransferase [Jatrophihabitans sp.]